MDIDGKPQWIMMGVATRRGVRVYASRELTRASIPVMCHGPSHEEPLITMQATGHNVLIIDGPDYPWILARIQQIWQANPLPELGAGPGWGQDDQAAKDRRAARLEGERELRRRAMAERMLPRYPAPGETVRVELDTSLPQPGERWAPQISSTERQEYKRPGLPSRPASEPLAIEAPRKDDEQ